MRRALWLILLVLVVAGVWLAVSLYFPYRGFPREGVFVDIPRGVSTRTIARLLAEKGVLRSRIVFELLSRWRARRVLQAGEYFFNRPVNAFQVFDTLASGRVYFHTMTVSEGYTMFDIADLVAQGGFTTREAFLEAARDPAPILSLAPRARTLEGFLFPATYQLTRHMPAPELVDAMVERFRETWASLAAQDRSGLSIEEVVTLASIVERETSVPSERPIVAAVFLNRLRRGLALQCDPTVIYALELAGKYRGALTAADLSFDSPYNTYRHTGLPPGPIANPSEASLRAVLDPAQVDYLYFVATAQGGHFFSRTLAEHNRNVAVYRRRLGLDNPAQAGADRPRRRPAKPRAPKKRR